VADAKEPTVSTPVTRRSFLQRTVIAAGAAPLIQMGGERRPNFLWLMWEDIGPHFGCYGDSYSVTPFVDRLAQRGCIYDNCWGSAPVCAPARTAIITGLCPTSCGAEHMRSFSNLPAGWKMFPGYLRDAGYYCVNNGKEDYNIHKPEGTWDISVGMVEYQDPIGSSTRGATGGGGRGRGEGRGFGVPDPANGHWRMRRPGQPFLAVFNDMTTHESQIFRSATNPNLVHDPSRAWVADFEPDTIEMRRDWAQYHDNLTEEDKHHQKRLDELAEDGLVDDTIIIVTSDHGSGVARYKRMPYDTGLRVPLIVIFPDKWRHLAPKDYVAGGRSDRLIGTIDLAPTMLSLAGIEPPSWYHGYAFAGRYEAPARSYLHGMRGRMDERHDLMRSTRDKRYMYIRNYNPHRIYGQHVNYAWSLPSTPVWERLYKEGKLHAPQTIFWQTKPSEELYDLHADKYQVKNLTASPTHKAVLDRFRKEHHEYELKVRDIGLLPEGEEHARAEGSTPYEMGHDPKKYPVERVLAAADLASSMRPGVSRDLQKLMADPDSGVRYWGVMGALIRGVDEVKSCHAALTNALKDGSKHVRIAAAEALGRYGTEEGLRSALDALIELADCQKTNAYVATYALEAIEAIGKKAAPLKDRIAALPLVDPKSPTRVNREYTTNLVKRLIEVL
jgi:arylsulfatase A-like enzyme